MSNFVEVIKECEAAGGAGTKNAIKDALIKADPIAQRLINEALNPFRVFGVRKYDMPSGGIRGMMAQVDYETFFSTLDKLVARELTGDAARSAVTAAIGLFPIFAHEYIARIFDKDLKAGFSADTFNKIHKNNPIATFEVMLAEKCEDTEDFEQYVKFPCQADFKYDGERTIAVVKADEITYFSRSGKEAVHCKGLFDADLYAWRKHLGYDFVLDGERCSDKGFTDTVNAKKSGNNEAKANLRFRAFFLMPLTDWSAQKTTITMKQNRDFLAALFSVGPAVEKIILTEGREVKDYADMMAYCNDAIDLPENAARKIEGLILKDWDAVYQWDRTFAWTKVKRMYDVDCKVVATYKGRAKSRLENVMGGISVVGFLESGERVEANVGSGFNDEDRVLDDWVGKVVVIKYQEVSRSKSKSVASLRFPIYMRCRDDKDVEV